MGVWLIGAVLLVKPQVSQARVWCSIVHMSEMELGSFLERFAIADMPEKQGFYILPKQKPKSQQSVSWIFQKTVPSPVRSVLLTREGKRYQFVDAGFKKLEEYSRFLNHSLLGYLVKNPDQVIRVDYTADYKQSLGDLYRLRWLIHDEVLAVYGRRKQYLSETDFELLKEPIKTSDNADVFAVFRPGFDMRASDQEIRENLAGAMQVSYHASHQFLRPSWLQILRSQINIDSVGGFPFEWRLEQNEYQTFIKKFENRFPKDQTSEITRYFFREPNIHLHDYLLAEVISRARERGMRYLVASGDPTTARLFEKYGFQTYDHLPTGQGFEKLIFLDMRSPEFHANFKRIRESKAALFEVIESPDDRGI